MNKEEFSRNLEKELLELGAKDGQKFTAYYYEMIEDYIEDGYSEEQAVKKVGSPKTIAQQILEEEGEVVLKVPSIGGKVATIALLIIGFPLWGSILATGALLVLTGYLLILCIPILTGTMTVAGIVGGIWSVMGAPFTINDGLHIAVTQFGIGVFGVGIGILSGLFTIFILAKLIECTLLAINKIKSIFRKKVVRI
jgi:uncharacterized membrane protein